MSALLTVIVALCAIFILIYICAVVLGVLFAANAAWAARNEVKAIRKRIASQGTPFLAMEHRVMPVGFYVPKH